MASEGKVALITGAARGIGAATALAFLDGGYTVIAVDVLDEDASAIRSDGAHRRYARCDVADEAQVERLIRSVEAEQGRIDVLANIAGVVLVKPIEETSWEEYRRVVDVNLGGTFLLCKHVVPLMKRQGGGAIVNMGSVSGHVGQTEHALYGATKGAIIALCRALAWELAPYHIRVNSISPGSVDTPMLRGDVETESQSTGLAFAQVKAQREREQALGRWADPAEIAAAIYFMAGDGASFITGTDLLVDSGWVAK